MKKLRDWARNRQFPYVFLIGFNRCGTTSFHKLFSVSGWPAIHWDKGKLAKTMLNNAVSGRKLFEGYDHKYRFFSDMVYESPRFRLEANKFFPVLDRDYPESFFILNNRDVEDWLASRKNKHFNRFGMSFVELEMSVSGMNSEAQVLEAWRHEFHSHAARVRSYFRGSPRFLELDISEPGLVESLSQFLSFDFAERNWTHIRTN